ncbi:sensor domain-containing diguanylate cyclase [Nocardia brevicatena]|uniref:sensor domain-containing diguanylate cyclase n=1 Tax=Nocardia brevicatena TaxID=37327 RepID=UPI0002F7E967|nr:sensor domain-containing diguanylate cyclase [Nocardia brevicatena]
MEEAERREVARSWSQALATVCGFSGPAREAGPLLERAVDQLDAALAVEPFRAEVGAQVGAALVTAGLAADAVLTVSALTLSRLADPDNPESSRRLGALLAAMGSGFEARRQALRNPDTHPADPVLPDTDRSADERFRVVFENAAVAIAIGDTDGNLLDANRGLADMIGVSVDALRGISVYDFAHPQDRERIRRMVYSDLVPSGKGTVKLEQRIGRADGSYGWASFSITFVKGDSGQSDYLLAVGEDVTEQHRMREELRLQARRDPLTGLPNRRHLLELLDATIAAAGSEDHIGLCFVDLDRFKDVNDHYGHGVGDRVLTAVAQRLHESVHGSGCVVSRIGGDEFVALIPPPADDTSVAEVANRLLDALAEPIEIGAYQLSISASIGAVVTTVVDGTAEALFDAADTGLYHAKNNGKGQWVLHTLDTQVPRARPDAR